MSLPGFTSGASLYTTKRHYCSIGAVNGRTVDGASFGAGVRETVLPMSEPGHQSFPGSSGECNDCDNNCSFALGGCVLNAGLACTPFWGVPGVGGFLYAGCVSAATAACYGAQQTCQENCHNIGSSCCPVACGASCCNGDEQCADWACRGFVDTPNRSA